MSGLRIADHGKLHVILVALIGSYALTGLGAVDAGYAERLTILALGYVFGNGRLAARGESPQPLIEAKPDDEQ